MYDENKSDGVFENVGGEDINENAESENAAISPELPGDAAANENIESTRVVPRVVPEAEADADATRVVPRVAAETGNENVFIPDAVENEIPPEILEDAIRLSHSSAAVSDSIAEHETEQHTRKWIPILICSAVCVFACFAILLSQFLPILIEGGLEGMSGILSPIVGQPPKDTNVLLVGTDVDGWRTDTMMVASYDHETDSVHVLQLPRDTYVANNGRRDKKLNSAYFNGIDTLKEEIYLAFGIEIHRYLAVELAGFVEMIDAIGGVEVDVPINMNYDDPVQDLHIHINKGVQVLDGKKAEGFVRFRKNNDGSGYPMGDLDRQKAQRQFISSAITQLVSVDGINRIPELIKIAQDNIETDISTAEATSYITKILSLTPDKIVFHDMPGGAYYKFGGSYFFVDKAETKLLITQFFNADNNKTPTSESNIYSSYDPVYEPDYSDYSSDDDVIYDADDDDSLPHASAAPQVNNANDDSDDDEDMSPGSSASPGATATATAKPSQSTRPTSAPSATVAPTATPTVTPKPTAAPAATGSAPVID